MIAAGLMAVALLADAAADVAKLDWLAGTWVSEQEGKLVRETWLAPKDGAMAGVGQTNRPGRKAFIEFTRITAEPAGATFTAFFEGQPPVAFVLKPGPDGEATFENLAHDFPQRVIYRRCGADLCSRVEGTVKGKLEAEDWRYRRER
ncbi:DUF6265 family protein [Phenylobacterium sp. J367]|uniref:DUF6265 family protein n=1 Tax=Phenylobacterium sp. J367 TaxID=2898435 RepID=UPI00215140EE|nr:DUF6265 family protein [Phenylobacterium sp. J367]MCR5877860.1 DUF6265 family protein [Phenylobacterium sp. J367]